MIGRSWAKHNQLFEKHNEQFEKRNRLLGNKKPSLGCETVSRGPFATVQMAISNRPNEKRNRTKRKKAGVGTPAFAPIIN